MSILITHFKPKEFFVSSDHPELVELPQNFKIYVNVEKVAQVLEQIRATLDCPIKITSGFRTEKLNRAVGGVDNSLHLIGAAADFLPVTGCTSSTNRTIVEYLGFVWRGVAKPSRTITYKDDRYELVDYGNRLHIGLRYLR